jgi:hypothetical protein
MAAQSRTHTKVRSLVQLALVLIMFSGFTAQEWDSPKLNLESERSDEYQHIQFIKDRQS